MPRKILLAAIILPLLLALSASLPAPADVPNATRTLSEGSITFTLIDKDGHTTLLATDAAGTLNFEAAFTTEADRAKVPPDIFNTYRLACVHQEFGEPKMAGDEWAILSARIIAVLKLQSWLTTSFDADPLRLFQDMPTDPQNPLFAPTQRIRDVLHNPVQPDANLKMALADYRDTRKKIEADLSDAQTALWKVVTIRQETILVHMGVLR